MRLNIDYNKKLQTSFSDAAVGDDESFKRILMIGTSIQNDGSLSVSDYKYLQTFLSMLLEEEKPLHRDFEISVMDFGSTGEDFLAKAAKKAPEATTDFALVACIPNIRASSDQQFIKEMYVASILDGEEGTTNWRSPLNRSLTAWNDACVQSTAQMVGTVAYQGNYEVNPQDFSKTHFSVLAQKTDNYDRKFSLLQKTL